MINAYMVDEVTVLKWNGADSWGEPESGDLVQVPAYVEWKTRLVRNASGEQVLSSVMVYLPKKIERSAYLGRRLTLEDKIWIDGESHERAIIEIQQPKHWSDPHYEVYLA